jgi:putative transposase
MRLCHHRSIPACAAIKHVVIKRMNDRWYVCLMLELPDPIPAPREVESAVGVDVGLHALLALSDGRIVANPGWLRESLAKLRVAQRRASRRLEGSQRRRKAYAQVARLYQHIADQRRDFLHQLANALVNEFTLIAIEDLRLAFMNRNHHLSLSSHDAGLGELRRLLEYKAEEASTLVVAVNPSHTSQKCSGCGEIVEKDLSVRVHTCPYCGLVLDRDVNAARNILQLAVHQPPGRGGQELTWAVAPCVS